MDYELGSDPSKVAAACCEYAIIIVLRQDPNHRCLASWEDAAKKAVENLKPESCLEVKPGDPSH